MMGTQAATHCCLDPFRWESLRGWYFRPQLFVVSGLFGGNPFVDGILGHNLLLSYAFSVGIPSWMGFRLSRSLSQTLLLFTIELWPSGVLFHKLFPPFFYDGILAIEELFTRTFSQWNSGYQGAFHTSFSFFTMEFWLSRSLSHELFFFHDGILAVKEPFTRIFLFSRWNSQNMRFGGDSFHIYHKEYLHRIRLVKNLAS
jgi:hypothetical protein